MNIDRKPEACSVNPHAEIETSRDQDFPHPTVRGLLPPKGNPPERQIPFIGTFIFISRNSIFRNT